jgi:hypothetical protein
MMMVRHNPYEYNPSAIRTLKVIQGSTLVASKVRMAELSLFKKADHLVPCRQM